MGIMTKKMLPPVLCLMGPTASGKTDLAMMLSKKLNAQLISVDSAQVYKGLDIGSGKPSKEVLQEYPHALIDILEPHQPYSAYGFQQDALAAIEDAHRAEKLPILVGGTMLYFKALQQGLAELPSSDAGLRQKIEEQAKHHGWPMLHQTLTEIDPVTAKRLEPNDAQRISRALEVYYSVGIPLSSLIKAQAQKTPSFDWINVGLMPQESERAKLHSRIEQRFDKMLADGLIDEVRTLMQNPQNQPELPAFKSVGYRQVIEHLKGEYDQATLVEKGYAATRQLAKRQLTWLRGWDNLHPLDCFGDNLLQMLQNILPESVREI